MGVLHVETFPRLLSTIRYKDDLSVSKSLSIEGEKPNAPHKSLKVWLLNVGSPNVLLSLLHVDIDVMFLLLFRLIMHICIILKVKQFKANAF